MLNELKIRDHNVAAHIDIEADIASKKNGIFTFTLRVNNGNIVDYNVLEYVDGREYLKVAEIVVKELIIASDTRE